MADTAAAESEDVVELKTAESVRLNESDKENRTPNSRMQGYKYKFYLEPHEDDEEDDGIGTDVESSSTGGGRRGSRQPLQEMKPIARSCDNLDSMTAGNSPPPPPPPPRRRTGTVTGASKVRPSSRRRISTLPNSAVSSSHRRRSENASSSAASSALQSSSSKRLHGRRSVGGNDHVRMGTRISLSALHRERLRLTTEMCVNNPVVKRSELDYDTMETKSLLPLAAAAAASVVPPPPLGGTSLLDDDENASLSESLIDRFDRMEAEDSEPERKIVAVTLARDPSDGRLGLKISGTPSGVYVDTIDGARIVEGGQLKSGDRLVAVNGRSLENVQYAGVLELIRKSEETVQFLVSQIS